MPRYKTSKSPWVSSQAAAEALGVSRWILLNSIRPCLSRGLKGHYRVKNPASAIPHYIWHKQRLLKWQEEQGDQVYS